MRACVCACARVRACVCASRVRLGRSSHCGLVCVFNDDTGLPTAVLDAAELTAMRTSAATAVATLTLAPKGSAVCAILG